MKKNKQRPKRYVISDVHGKHESLISLLRKVNFDKDVDTLFFLGDICDGGDKTIECIETLLSVKNLYACYGNHDLFLEHWVNTNIIDKRWVKINNYKTIQSIKDRKYAKKILKKYFDKCKPYYIFEDMFFCHAGFNPKKYVEKQKHLTYSINRTLWKIAKQYDRQKLKIKIKTNTNKLIKNIFIGHSVCKSKKPETYSNVTCLDTGILSDGYLTIMDIDNKKYWQSK